MPGEKRIGLRSPACVKFMHSDEKSQLNFIELARDLTHRGCAVLPILICSHSAEDISVMCETVHEMDNGVIQKTA